jgi:hypothetical protein
VSELFHSPSQQQPEKTQLPNRSDLCQKHDIPSNIQGESQLSESEAVLSHMTKNRPTDGQRDRLEIRLSAQLTKSCA